MRINNRERWHLAKIDDLRVKKVAEELGVEFILAKILLARNIGGGNPEEIKKFIFPDKALITDFEQVSTPDRLKKATSRIIKAIENKEKIMVNGDPDADGISGTTIIVATLRSLGADVEFDFPTRSKEGHGLQVRIIDYAKDRGAKLIITTDCGSKDLQAAQYAKEIGMDVIITDHHILGKELPDCYAMINPNLVAEKTNFKTLSGASVAFKTMLALFNALGKPMPKELQDYLLSVASLGTLSDRMTLLNPMNRVMVKEGVHALSNTKMEGLKALKRVCMESNTELRPRDLTRSIIPRLNAPGRIGDREAGIPDSSIVVELLLIGTGKDSEKAAENLAGIFADVVALEKQKMDQGAKKTEAFSTASDVDSVNEKRKFITNKIEEEMDKLIDEQIDPIEDKIIIIQGKNWNAGVIGIDTDRLKERFLRPAIILTKYDGNDYVRGSCRSIPNIDMYGIIDRVGEQFLELYKEPLYQMQVTSLEGETQLVNAFGGHAQACGFSIHEKNVKTFIKLIKEEADKLPEEQFEYHYDIIDKLPFSQVSKRLLNQLDKLSPYGQQFEYPTFYLQGCVISEGKPFGNKYQTTHKPHVNFTVIEKQKKQMQEPPREFKAVGFGLWEKLCLLRSNLDPNMRYDVIFTVEIDERSNRKHQKKEIRLNVSDIRQSGENVDSFLEPALED